MEQPKHRQGLTSDQVAESRRKYGENVLTPPKREPLWRQFLEKFEDPIIRILLVALLASVGIACFEYHEGGDASVFLEPSGIFVAVMLATGIGFWFEVKANRAFLKKQGSGSDNALSEQCMDLYLGKDRK